MLPSCLNLKSTVFTVFNEMRLHLRGILPPLSFSYVKLRPAFNSLKRWTHWSHFQHTSKNVHFASLWTTEHPVKWSQAGSIRQMWVGDTHSETACLRTHRQDAAEKTPLLLKSLISLACQQNSNCRFKKRKKSIFYVPWRKRASRVLRNRPVIIFLIHKYQM